MDYTPLNRLPIIEEIEGLKEQLDSLRPLPSDVEGKIFQKLRIDWNYHSNAIEGNQLTRGETVQLIMEGLTAKGKSLRDHLDVQGHEEAVDFMMQIIKGESEITEVDLKNINTLLLGSKPFFNRAQSEDGLIVSRQITPGRYKKEPNSVLTKSGKMHFYTSPVDTPKKMNELINWLNQEIKSRNLHPLVLASILHHRFVSIHPFDDGNGRTTRILMNLVLLKFNLPVIIIKKEEKINYYGYLREADEGDYKALINFFGSCLIRTLNTYLEKEVELNEEDLKKQTILFIKSQKHRNKLENSLKSSFFEFYLELREDLQIKLNNFKNAFKEIVISLSRKSDDWTKLPIKTTLEELKEKFNLIDLETNKYHFGLFIYLTNPIIENVEDNYHFIFSIRMNIDNITLEFSRNKAGNGTKEYFSNSLKSNELNQKLNTKDYSNLIWKYILEEITKSKD